MNVEPASAVILSFPPQHRQVRELIVKPQEHKIRVAPSVRPKLNRVKIDLIDSREALPLIYMNSKGYFTKDVIEKIRAGWHR